MTRERTSESAFLEPSCAWQLHSRNLVNEALRFARAKGNKRRELRTADVLVTARRIFETAGFELLQEEPQSSFGKDLDGQVWGRNL